MLHILEDSTKAIVLEELSDEYKAQAFYRLVLNTFGEIRRSVIKAEETHARALVCAGTLEFHCPKMTGKRSLTQFRLCAKPVGPTFKGNTTISPCMTAF